MKPRIPYTKPSIGGAELAYAYDAVRGMADPDRCYHYIERFEQEFAAYLGVPYAIATSSCTGALQMGMAALGIGPGDEVIMADTCWIATAAAIVRLGAKPVFVDILPDSWCIDPERAEAAVTDRTKAIIAVHLYGNLCDVDRLLKLGSYLNIPIIEDAAEAIGTSYYGGRLAGSMGAFGAFSFHGSKTISTGEGGMFVTRDTALYEKVLALSYHGRARGAKQFWSDEIGFKYRMSNVQAAIGCGQVERVDELVRRKREILAYYRAALEHTGVAMNPEPTGTINGAWMPTVVFDRETGVTREKLQAAFAAENIDARVFFWPLSSMQMFESKPENVNAYDVPGCSINLPSYHDMTHIEQDRVIEAVKKVIYGA